ncbi:hypothetical protein PsalN5692_01551 [Piscirickettsia salmonis]|nr:hypothetical protein PsalN5692_01551 [Piscirickettsia salmonis]QGP54505.1 hypothetical protein PsalSR1_01945 [Piscirickettsia salmonis]QGP59614.1 hypothetical protein PsalBI1_02203 [Piscirickettsia salmonis]QGP64298.1 hypothetical protein PsalMR5_02165 [Piscirickettsia salmonis]
MHQLDSIKLSKLQSLYMDNTKKLTIGAIRNITNQRTYRETQDCTVKMFFANLGQTTSSNELDKLIRIYR